MVKAKTQTDSIPSYFSWICKKIYNPINGQSEYSKLLKKLFDTEFVYEPFDYDRARDGIALRGYYQDETGKDPEILGECNLLEMMVALVERYENSVMYDPQMGDRTGQWFWNMIVSLGLSGMTDENYDEKYASSCIERLESHRYDSDGKGGLFTIKNTPIPVNEMPIYVQINYFMNQVLEDEGVLSIHS